MVVSLLVCNNKTVWNQFCMPREARSLKYVWILIICDAKGGEGSSLIKHHNDVKVSLMDLGLAPKQCMIRDRQST